MQFLFFLLPLALFGGAWAEDLLAKMSLEEKIGQLFVAPACPLREEDHWRDWEELLEKYHVGGVIMKQASPVSHVKLVNRLQKRSREPLLVVADAEWGLAMRLSDTIAFPRNEVLGKRGDLALIQEIGEEVGKECRRIGIHLNLAPVSDVNNNPGNRVIGSRSFGAEPKVVAECVQAAVRGLGRGGVMSCAKHFPGHGDTAVDSHVDLPVISHSRERLGEVELVPFRAAIAEGVSAVMSAHILVPAIDPKFPATLSRRVLQGLLREELGFTGLVVTDALNMKALTNFYSAKEIALEAHRAGCDLLVYGDHIAPNVDDIVRRQIPEAYLRLQEAYQKEELPESFLNEKVLRILQAKEKSGLDKNRFVVEEGVADVLWSSKAVNLSKRAALR